MAERPEYEAQRVDVTDMPGKMTQIEIGKMIVSPLFYLDIESAFLR